MGLFKTTNETHYHVSEEAARQQKWAAIANKLASKDQKEATEAEARAAAIQAEEEREALQERLKFEEKMRLLEKDPELYKAFVKDDKRKKRRKTIGTIIAVIIYLILMIVVLGAAIGGGF